MVIVLAGAVGGCASGAVSSPAAPSAIPATSPSTTPSSLSSSAIPTPVGETFASSRYGYSVVVPEGWTVVETPGTGGLHPDEPGVDTYRDGQGHILSVVGERLAGGQGLDAWTCAIGRHLTGEHETPIESTTAIDAAGQDARLTRYHLHIDPYVIHYLDVEVVNGDMGLAFSMESTTGRDVEDEALLRSLIGTLALDG